MTSLTAAIAVLSPVTLASASTPPPAPRIRIAPPRPAADAPLPPALAPLAPWLPVLSAAADGQGMPRGLVYALALVESSGDASARSWAGGYSLLQVTPVAARQVHLAMRTPTEAAYAGVAYLALCVRWARVPWDCLHGGPAGCGAVLAAIGCYEAGPAGEARGDVAPGYVAAVVLRWREIAREGAVA